MQVRKLTQKERPEAGLISTVSFHGRIDNMDERVARWEADTTENWGAFDDDGTMMGHIVNNRFQCYFDGHVVECGGIGGVSALPEYRESGAIRAIFASLLPEARRNGEVLSTLFPFRHSFYRKFGYETTCYGTNYEIPTNALPRIRHDGWIKMWRPGDPTEQYTALYAPFACRYNTAIFRDDARMASVHIKGDCYKDRYFCYLLGDSEGPSAYVAFQDSAPKLSVKDYAWNSRRGFTALLNFLSRFSADYSTVVLPAPSDIDLMSFMDNPYSITASPHRNFMARVINAEKALSLLKKPEGVSFTVKINDEMIPENNAIWLVRGDEATQTDAQPDITLSERAFSILAIGAIGLQEAVLRNDVEINGNEETLRRVFVRKPIYIADHF